MSAPHLPLFDPLRHPSHKTVPEWDAAGTNGWFVNLIVYCLAYGEARVLLRCGAVLKFTFTAPGPIQAEELP